MYFSRVMISLLVKKSLGKMVYAYEWYDWQSGAPQDHRDKEETSLSEEKNRDLS